MTGQFVNAGDIIWSVGDDGIEQDPSPQDAVELAATALEEAQSYRCLAQQAIHRLHLQQAEITVLQIRNRQARTQIRSLLKRRRRTTVAR